MDAKYLKNIRLSERFLPEGDQCSFLPRFEEVLEWFKMLNAGWVHGGDFTKPHVILHSGKHSNGFFLCKKLLGWGNLREVVAACMVNELKKAGLGKIDGVFGSPYSSILLAGDIGRLLGVKTYVPEKDPKDPEGKRMYFKPDDPIPGGSVILQIEELVTMFGSGETTKQAIIASNPEPITFAPFVSTFVFRPPVIDRNIPDGRILVPFIEKQVDAWEPGDCPLCKQGSVALAPKGENWAKLTA